MRATSSPEKTILRLIVPAAAEDDAGAAAISVVSEFDREREFFCRIALIFALPRVLAAEEFLRFGGCGQRGTSPASCLLGRPRLDANSLPAPEMGTGRGLSFGGGSGLMV